MANKQSIIPEYIKDKMRKRHKLALESNALSNEIANWFIKNGIENEEMLRAGDGDSCEALTFLEYGEGDVERVIAECEDWYREQKESEHNEPK